MVLARLGDGFGLGLFDEAGIGEATAQAVALLFRRGERLGEARLFRRDVDHAFQRKDEGRFIHHDLRRAARRRLTEAEAFDPAEPRQRHPLPVEPAMRVLGRAAHDHGQLRAGRDVEFGARGADRAHQADQPVDLGLRLLVDGGQRLGPLRHDQFVGACAGQIP